MALFGRETEQNQQRAEAWASWFRQRNPCAVASTVLGVFSLVEFGVLGIFGIAGITLGVIALKQIRRPDTDRPLGSGLAWTGIITSAASLVLAVIVYTLPAGGP